MQLSIEDLRVMPAQMAEAIRPLFSEPTLERYKRFLNTMYHYTRYSAEEIRHAAETIQDEELRTLLNRLAREEATHYRLAAADLSEFGESPEENAPDEVLAFRQYWMSIEPQDGFRFLGLLFSLEGVADHSKEDVLAALSSLGLEKKQARFLLTHLQADEGHSQLLLDAVTKHFAVHQKQIMLGAKDGARYWVRMHLNILDGDGNHADV